MEEIRRRLHSKNYSATIAATFGVGTSVIGSIILAVLAISLEIPALVILGIVMALGLTVLMVFLIRMDAGRRNAMQEKLEQFTESDILYQIQNRCILAVRRPNGAPIYLFVTEKYVVFCGQFLDERSNIKGVRVDRYKGNVRFYFTTKENKTYRCVSFMGLGCNTSALSMQLKNAIFR